jgi:hypothetical protein
MIPNASIMFIGAVKHRFIIKVVQLLGSEYTGSQLKAMELKNFTRKITGSLGKLFT